ncbi:hypothetical protein [Blastococcus deserti]|uniref:Cu-Zn family superoxide dismutase n=1 Tax=Blastococcus deserti TaxID=2259033 RepID=A0ABW4XHA8_9ACTN
MDRRQSRTTRTAVALGAAALLVALGSPQAAAGEVVRAKGSFSPSGPAWTYDGVVPSGATAAVHAVEIPSRGTIATLHVRGFPASTEFMVHAHTGGCGSDPAASQGHYQDQVGGPVDDVNELWLGFTTTRAGTGFAKAAVDWHFREGEANSLTFHDPSRNGKRVACLPVAF